MSIDNLIEELGISTTQTPIIPIDTRKAVYRRQLSDELFNRAADSAKMGNLPLSQRILEIARNHDLADDHMLENLGKIYFKYGEIEKWADAWSSIDIRTPAMNSLLASYHHLKGNINQVFDIISEINDPDYLLNQANQFEEVGDFELAADILKESIQRGLDIPATYSNLGILYHKHGQTQRARETWMNVVDDGTADSTALFGLFITTQNPDERLLYASKLLEIIDHDDNHDYRAYFYLAQIVDQGDVPSGLSKSNFIEAMAKQMFNNGEFEDMIGGYDKASHKISVITSDKGLEKTIAVKISDKSFDDEINNIDEIGSILNNTGIKTTTSLGQYRLPDGRYFYLMAFEDSPTVTDRIKDGTLQPEIYDSLVLAEAKIAAEKNTDRIEVYPVKEKLTNRMKNLAQGTDITDSEIELVVDMLYHNTGADNPQRYVVHSDPKTDNYLVSNDGKITYIDTENKGTAPIALMIAMQQNEISFTDSVKEQITSMEKYLSKYNMHTQPDRRISVADFRDEFFHGVLDRTLTGKDVYASIGRHEDSRTIAQSGLKMLNHMQENDLLKGEKRNYDTIRKLLVS